MSFFLTEDLTERPEYDLHEGTALPCKDRRPIDPGFVLTWREFGPEQTWADAVERRGMVHALAPRARSVWVIPDERLPGEGFAVVVDTVTREDCSLAVRRRGWPEDYLSTEGWQSPRTLPRAILRVDHTWCSTSVGQPRHPVALLHSVADCPEPTGAAFMDVYVDRGEPTTADECYLFDGYLHPMSVRPTVSGADRFMGLDPYARECTRCLRGGNPGRS